MKNKFQLLAGSVWGREGVAGYDGKRTKTMNGGMSGLAYSIVTGGQGTVKGGHQWPAVSLLEIRVTHWLQYWLPRGEGDRHPQKLPTVDKRVPD